jgi:hypothetical protein
MIEALAPWPELELSRSMPHLPYSCYRSRLYGYVAHQELLALLRGRIVKEDESMRQMIIPMDLAVEQAPFALTIHGFGNRSVTAGGGGGARPARTLRRTGA